MTHDTGHVTHGEGWTFSQKFSSLPLTVWDGQCLKNSERKDDRPYQWINEQWRTAGCVIYVYRTSMVIFNWLRNNSKVECFTKMFSQVSCYTERFCDLPSFGPRDFQRRNAPSSALKQCVVCRNAERWALMQGATSPQTSLLLASSPALDCTLHYYALLSSALHQFVSSALN